MIALVIRLLSPKFASNAFGYDILFSLSQNVLETFSTQKPNRRVAKDYRTWKSRIINHVFSNGNSLPNRNTWIILSFESDDPVYGAENNNSLKFFSTNGSEVLLYNFSFSDKTPVVPLRSCRSCVINQASIRMEWMSQLNERGTHKR